MPDVRKLTLAEAQARVEESQPLTPELVYKPAEPLQQPSRRRPGSAPRLPLSYDRIILIVTKATQGVIRLVGRDVADARLRLKRLEASAQHHLGGGRVGHLARAEDGRGSPPHRALRSELVASRARATAAG